MSLHPLARHWGTSESGTGIYRFAFIKDNEIVAILDLVPDATPDLPSGTYRKHVLPNDWSTDLSQPVQDITSWPGAGTVTVA